MYEQRGSKKGLEDNVYCPLLLNNGKPCVLVPSVCKDFLSVVHSALILYSLPRRVSLGTILYRKQVYFDTFRISVQKKIRCLLFRELETLPALMCILRMALLIHVIIKVLNRADLKFFRSVNKAKKLNCSYLIIF